MQRCQPGDTADAPASAYSAVIGIRSTDNVAMVYRALRPQARRCTPCPPTMSRRCSDSMSVESTPHSGRRAAMAQLRQNMLHRPDARGPGRVGGACVVLNFMLVAAHPVSYYMISVL